MRGSESTTSRINTSDVEQSMGVAVGKNHVRGCRSLRDPLTTGELATLVTDPIRSRKDMGKKPGSLKNILSNLLKDVAQEATEMQKNVWGERPNEFRTPLENGYDFVIRITDAASSHTKKTFEHDGDIYSGMIMLWFSIEESRTTTADSSESSSNLLIRDDDASPSGVSFFSNKELISDYSSLSDAVKKLLADSLSIAVGFLQDKLQIDDKDVGKMMDISMGIGSRLSSETLTGRQPPASQSGPLGHIVIVYHDDAERDTKQMQLLPASSPEMIKVMDPWIELISHQLGSDMLTIAKKAITENEATSEVEVNLKSVWDGFDIEFPQAVSLTTSYSVSSAIYSRFATIHQYSVQYYKTFLIQSQDVITSERGTFIQQLRAYGLSDTTAESYVTFLEKLQPSTAIVKELRQSGVSIDRHKNELLQAFEERVKKYNTEQARTKRFEQRAKHQDHLVKVRAELMNLLAIQNPSEDQKLIIGKLQSLIVSYQKHVLMAEIYSQRFLDPVFGSTKRSDEETKQLDTLTQNLNILNQKKNKTEQDFEEISELQKNIASFPDKSEAISTILPLDTLNAVNLIRDFSLESETDEILVSTQKLCFTTTGRGGYEVMTESGQIKRERPA